jgi:hypothetical protein
MSNKKGGFEPPFLLLILSFSAMGRTLNQSFPGMLTTPMILGPWNNGASWKNF